MNILKKKKAHWYREETSGYQEVDGKQNRRYKLLGVRYTQGCTTQWI